MAIVALPTFYNIECGKSECSHKSAYLLLLNTGRIVVNVLERREYDIVDILLENPQLTISQIAKKMNLSYRTISKSLDVIENFFEGSEIKLIRKPKVGVSLNGSRQVIADLINQSGHHQLPTTKLERVQFICFKILKNTSYFTLQKLSELLFISKTTLDKDMVRVNEIFNQFHVTIEKIPGKGSFLNIMEYERRRLALDLIHYFWGQNWQVIQQDNHYIHTIEGIPDFAQEFINISMLKKINDIVQNYMQFEKIKMSDMGYQSLILHILIAVERIKNDGLLQENDRPLLQNYSDFEDVRPLVTSIENTFDIGLSKLEIQYIGFHLKMSSYGITALSDSTIKDSDVEAIILRTNHSLSESRLQGLVAHLKVAVERIKNNLPLTNPYTNDIKTNFPLSFDEAIAIKKNLEDFYQINVPEDEMAYIAVHIQAQREQAKLADDSDLKVLLVCSSGKGTAQLLAARLRRVFPDLKINRILSVNELWHTEITEGLVLSTVNITLPDHPLIVVSPILNQTDDRRIKQFLSENKRIEIIRNIEFSKLIHPELVFLDLDLESKEAVIEYIGRHLVQKGFATEGIIQSALAREEFSATSFGKYATPHGKLDYVRKSAIVFLRLNHEIEWGDQSVRFIFFICVSDENPKELEKIFDSLLEIIDENQHNILQRENQQKVIKYLKEGI